MALKPWQKDNSERDRDILELREKGVKLREIAAKYDISGSRVSAIEMRERSRRTARRGKA